MCLPTSRFRTIRESERCEIMSHAHNYGIYSAEVVTYEMKSLYSSLNRHGLNFIDYPVQYENIHPEIVTTKIKIIKMLRLAYCECFFMCYIELNLYRIFTKCIHEHVRYEYDAEAD